MDITEKIDKYLNENNNIKLEIDKLTPLQKFNLINNKLGIRIYTGVKLFSKDDATQKVLDIIKSKNIPNNEIMKKIKELKGI